MKNKKGIKDKLRTRVRLILLMLLVIILIPVGVTFSKYISDFIGNYLVKTSNFYFSSDKLGKPTITYNVNNWGGVGTFKIEFELNNHKNNLLVSDSDIEYDIVVSHPDDVSCTFENVSGVIYTTEMTDKYELIVTPLRIFNTNESVRIGITATSSAPYVKALSAVYIITVGRKGISYEINDAVNQPYLNLSITNARDNYKVFDPWGDYELNHEFTIDEYKALTPAEQAKCYSARITLTFDPTDVVIDTTNNLLNNSTYTTTTINGVAYISSITFDVDAMSSNVIRFYKVDVSENYTYTGTGTPIITFNAL